MLQHDAAAMPRNRHPQQQPGEQGLTQSLLVSAPSGTTASDGGIDCTGGTGTALSAVTCAEAAASASGTGCMGAAASGSGRIYGSSTADLADGPGLIHASSSPARVSALDVSGQEPDLDPDREQGSEQERRQRRQVIASSIVGNLLEWYDFLVFAYQSVVIAKLFFPQSDTYTRYLSVYGIFAAGFVTRPLGALFFGWIGDRYSRKAALLASIYMMSVPTALMGCLPTYSQVGRLAPWLLVLTRIVQGFAVGGEFTTTMVFLVEHAPRGEAGLQGSWAMFSVLVGVLVGSCVCMLFNVALTDAQLYAWGWRLPFFLSVLGAAVGAYVRRFVHEPPPSDHHHHHHHHLLGGGTEEGTDLLGEGQQCPGKSRFRSWLQSPIGRATLGSVTVFVIDFLTAVGFYLVVIFLPTYFQEFVGLSRRQAMSVHTANIVLYMLLIPVGGALSDRLGRVPLVFATGLAMAVLATPLWRLLSTKDSVMAALEGQALLCVIMALFNGALPATITTLFHPDHRCKGVSLGHNMSMAIFGGTAPLIATALMRATGSGMAPAGMLVVAALLTAGGAVMARSLFGMR